MEPTVRVKSVTDRVSSKQTGYNRKYISPPLQVLLSQALLGGLAEVGFVGNLMGLDHCVKMFNVNICSMMTFSTNVQNCGHGEKASNFKYGCWESYKLALTLRQNDQMKSNVYIKQWRTYFRQEESWWPKR